MSANEMKDGMTVEVLLAGDKTKKWHKGTVIKGRKMWVELDSLSIADENNIVDWRECLPLFKIDAVMLAVKAGIFKPSWINPDKMVLGTVNEETIRRLADSIIAECAWALKPNTIEPINKTDTYNLIMSLARGKS